MDEKDRLVPDASVKLKAWVEGKATLAAFGSANPKTEENYTKGEFTTYRGKAMAILRDGYEAGSTTLTVEGDGFERATITIS